MDKKLKWKLKAKAILNGECNSSKKASNVPEITKNSIIYRKFAK